MTDLRQRVEALTPAERPHHYCAGYLDCKADVLALLDGAEGTCPWARRTTELFDKEGHYADYAAWREWAFEDEAFSQAVDTLGDLELIHIYGVMCKLTHTTPRGEAT